MPEPDATPAISYATPTEFRRDVLIVRPSRTLGIVFVAMGSLGLAFCGVLLLVDAAGLRTDYLLKVTLGAFTVAVGVHQLTDREPRLILNDSALLSTIGNRLELRWPELAEARTVTHSDGATYLILRLVDPAAEPQPETLWNRPDFHRPPEAANEDILLPIGGLDHPADLILAEIRKRIPPQLNRPAADITS
jgi:hypothetical protein